MKDSNDKRQLFYDLETLKSIPIEDVCRAFGIEIVGRNRSKWFKIRNEKTPSCKIYTDTNTFCDFGNGMKGGNTINLVAAISNCSNAEAMTILAEMFGIEPENRTNSVERGISDFMYKKIGLYGDLATKNMKFDIESLDLEVIQKISLKYQMPMNELRKEFPKVYESILRNRAIPFVLEKRNSYYLNLYNTYSLLKTVYGQAFDKLPETYVKKHEQQLADLESAEKVLVMAVAGTELNYKPRSYDIQGDYSKIVNGDIQPEIGTMRYFNLRQQGRAENKNVFYKSVPFIDYGSLMELGLDNITHSAFVKDDSVNMAFYSEDKDKIFSLIIELEEKQAEKETPKPEQEQKIDVKPEVSSLDALILKAESEKDEMKANHETNFLAHNDMAR